MRPPPPEELLADPKRNATKTSRHNLLAAFVVGAGLCHEVLGDGNSRFGFYLSQVRDMDYANALRRDFLG